MMTAKTPQEFIEKEAPLRFKPEKVKGIEATAQLNVTGPTGGNWIVIIKDQKLNIAEGTHPSPTLTLKVSDADFMDIVNGNLSAEKAFFTGRIQFKGNLATALKLREAGFL